MGPHVLLILTISITACSRIGPTIIPSGAMTQGPGSDMNADQGNLAAIKALLARDREQFGRSSATSAGNAVEPFHQVPHIPSSLTRGWDAASSIGITSTFPHGLFLVPPQTTEHHQQVSQVQRIPIQRSSPDYRMHQSPSVPPYTSYAPVGSVYPGTIRCVPDYLGGQRCHNTP